MLDARKFVREEPGGAVVVRQAFTSRLLDLAKHDPQLFAVATDSRGSVTLGDFSTQLPRQFVEVGIAEQDAVGIGAGLALAGKNVFVCGPACFLSTRSLEQVKVDVGYNGTSVKLIAVSGGVSYGPLGATHHSLHDLAVMRALSGLRVELPCDAVQMEALTEEMAADREAYYVRMGRGGVPAVYLPGAPFQIGQANLLREGCDVTLLSAGELVAPCLEAAKLLAGQGVSARVVDLHSVKPLDTKAVLDCALHTRVLVTVEEHSRYGGLGAAVAETVVQHHPVPMTLLGLPDHPVMAGTSSEVFQAYGLDAQGIAQAAQERLEGQS